MSNKLILEELFRMREIMGISLSETIKNKIRKHKLMLVNRQFILK